MTESDTAPAARFTDYEISYTCGDHFTGIEWFRIGDGPLAVADLPEMIASRHRYRALSADQVAVLRIEIVADAATGTVLDRWLRELDNATSTVELRMIAERAEQARITGPDAARRVQAEVFSRRLRERQAWFAGSWVNDHAPHDEGLYLQPLPDCLAPSPAERAAQTLLHMPHAGELVVLADDCVLWLERNEPDSTACRDNTAAFLAPIKGRHACEGAAWDTDSLTPVDPADLGLDRGDNEAISAAWDLLIDDANQAAFFARHHGSAHTDLYGPPIGEVAPRRP